MSGTAKQVYSRPSQPKRSSAGSGKETSAAENDQFSVESARDFLLVHVDSSKKKTIKNKNIRASRMGRKDEVAMDGPDHTTAKRGERPENITARGTVRIRRKPGTVRGEEATLSTSIPVELKERFGAVIKQQRTTQVAVLTQLIEDYIEKNEDAPDQIEQALR